MGQSASYCLNPDCPQPHNSAEARFCESCGQALWLGDRYRPLEPLGQGSFGRTFIARDEQHPHHRRCVIKQFCPRQPGAETRRQAADLFRREAEQLKYLAHLPQIPDFYDYLEDDGAQYLVQEWIEGDTLEAELKAEGAFSELKIREVLMSLLPVLQALHDRQIIHRDLKPTNIIRRTLRPGEEPSDTGDLVLVDFGASKYATPTLLAETGTMIGSAGYAAPEQVMGKAEFASDLYSLGVTCIHLLTGMHPFDLYAPSEDAWIWPDYLTSPVSDRLTDVLNKLLQRPTRLRYRTAQAALDALTRPEHAMVQVRRREPLQEPPITAIVRDPIVQEPMASPDEDVPADRPDDWNCVFTLTGHSGPITALAISPDGTLFASGSTDHSIKLWVLESGQLLHTFNGRSFRHPNGHSESVRSLAFSVDGRTLISGSDDCTLKWWDVETRRLLWETPEHGWSIGAIAISQNGRVVATGGGDGLINLWQQGDADPIAQIRKHRDGITSLLLSPDGNTLISASADRSIRLWDLGSDRLIRTLWGHEDRVSAIAISRNWLTLISGGGDRTLRFWDLSQGKATSTVLAHRDRITSLALAPNQRLLATASEDSRLKLWPLTETEAGILQGDRHEPRPLVLPHPWGIGAVVFSPNSRILVSGGADETLRIWQAIPQPHLLTPRPQGSG